MILAASISRGNICFSFSVSWERSVVSLTEAYPERCFWIYDCVVSLSVPAVEFLSALLHEKRDPVAKHAVTRDKMVFMNYFLVKYNLSNIKNCEDIRLS